MTFSARGNWLGANWCIDVLDENGHGIVSNLNVHHITINSLNNHNDIRHEGMNYLVAGRQETEIYIQVLETDITHEDINNLMHSQGALLVKPDPRSATNTRFDNAILTNINWEAVIDNESVILGMLWKSYSGGFEYDQILSPREFATPRPIPEMQKLDWRKYGF